MADSYIPYLGNGVQTEFAISFPFLDRDHIFVDVDEVDTPFEWINDGLISIDPAPAVDTEIRVYRETPGNRVTDFETDSMLIEAEIDRELDHILYIAQEAKDKVQSTTDEAVDRAETAADEAEAAAEAAGDSEDAAALSATNAAESESNADTAATVAYTAATNASLAEEAAATSSTTAAGYASDAMTYRDAALTAQGEAETAQTNAETAQGLAEDARDQALVNATTEWHTGTTEPPSGSLGKDGDHYHCTVSSNLYKKASGSWSLEANIKGEAFEVDAYGLLSTRSTYDDEATGFAFLATDTGDLYIKNSATTADWSDAIAFRGPQGNDGATFYRLTSDPTTEGVNGDFAINVTSMHLWYKSSDTWADQGSIKGDTGDTGATGAAGADGTDGTDGNTWYSGSGAPDDGDGVDGDYYLNETNQDVYKKASGTWGSVLLNIKGVAGSITDYIQRFDFPGECFGDSSVGDDLFELLMNEEIWYADDAVLESVKAQVRVDDSSGTQPQINIVIGSNATDTLSINITLAETVSSGTINTSYDDISTDDRFKVVVRATGTNADAEDLTVWLKWSIV